jgi:hypothetical protein
MYKDSVKNLAAKMTKKKTTNGTADTQARRAGDRGVPSDFTASLGSGNQYRTTGSSSKKINDGKRVFETKDTKGMNQYFIMGNDGELIEVFDIYNSGQKSSDAIVTPRTRR